MTRPPRHARPSAPLLLLAVLLGVLAALMVLAELVGPAGERPEPPDMIIPAVLTAELQP